MGGRVSNDQCEIILGKGGSREPNPDDHRPNMGKAGTLTAVAARKQCAWANDIYSPKKWHSKMGSQQTFSSTKAERICGSACLSCMDGFFLFVCFGQKVFGLTFLERQCPSLIFWEADGKIIHNRANMELVGRIRWGYFKASLFLIYVPYEP